MLLDFCQGQVLKPFVGVTNPIFLNFFFKFNNLPKVGKLTIGQVCPLLGKLHFSNPYKQTKLKPNRLISPHARK